MNQIDKSTIRWEVLLRYQLIEIIALWEGRIITNHLCSAFGIGRQQASKDINAYRSCCLENLSYDKRAKGYVPGDKFKPYFTQGTANEYLHLLNANKALASVFESSDFPVSYTEVMEVPNRIITPEILRPITKACREKLRLDITYCSMTSPEGEDRIISPHTLVYSGVRWHVRAYCEKHKDYRDFVINRIKSIDDTLGKSIENSTTDTRWHNFVNVQLIPNPQFTISQQSLIARDYAMLDNLLTLNVRSSLVQYTLDQLNVATQADEQASANLVLQNRDELKAFLQ
ncbi:conserved hypothetical protein [Psychromonas ingrahamii 37]|uniref:Uncharacterized protein n=1 Tax=Psychromonas ingrahamii (strain DSM 17664 / CCUG 51855 / 37) TaxID=357804 RepID=A1SXJ2_PSYIN|nr:WYL domain-containing protein [Psychromonas ingrahamii]ABM04207.1 conserved hypothetical protein [Psychromonas ingrahamii 37]